MYVVFATNSESLDKKPVSLFLHLALQFYNLGSAANQRQLHTT